MLEIYILQWCQSTIYDYKKTNLLEYICHYDPNHNVVRIMEVGNTMEIGYIVIDIKPLWEMIFYFMQNAVKYFYSKTCTVNFQTSKRL